MTKAEIKTLDNKVLAMVKRQGTVCPNTVASTFGIKWESARRSLDRLVKAGHIFYHPEMGKSPMVYSIWPKVVKGGQFLPIFENGQTPENREKKDPKNDRYVRLSRASTPTHVEKKTGFVCHPKTVASKLGPEFVGAHFHGQFTVEILKVGLMPETFLVKGTEITGGWISKVMPIQGNTCYYGHIKFPDDREKFNVHTMATKDGRTNTLSVYVHRRYVYYKQNDEIAMLEFQHQIDDVCDVLRHYGWEFGDVNVRGNYSAALNSREFAAQVPKYHVETSDDIIKFDSSVGSADGVCTEAEIVHDHPGASDEMTALVEAPQRLIKLEKKVDSLITVLEKVTKATELAVNTVVNGEPYEQYVKPNATQGDVMFGRL